MTRARKRAIRIVAAIAFGAAASGCGGSSGVGSVTGQPSGSVTLLDVQTQVFSPRCATAGCHVGAGAPFGLDLSAGLTAGNTINVPASEIPSLMRVEPGDSADSYLYMKVIDDPRILGDRMPGGGGALSAADLELIRDWIDQGAQ